MCSTQVNDKLTGELALFCPLERCSHYQKPDNKIKKDGIYRTHSDPVPRQMYYCHRGGHRFSETHYSELKHKQLYFPVLAITGIKSITYKITQIMAKLQYVVVQGNITTTYRNQPIKTGNCKQAREYEGI